MFLSSWLVLFNIVKCLRLLLFRKLDNISAPNSCMYFSQLVIGNELNSWDSVYYECNWVIFGFNLPTLLSGQSYFDKLSKTDNPALIQDFLLSAHPCFRYSMFLHFNANVWKFISLYISYRLPLISFHVSLMPLPL